MTFQLSRFFSFIILMLTETKEHNVSEEMLLIISATRDCIFFSLVSY